MWTVSYTGTSTATPDEVFAVLADVDTWPAWNAGVTSVTLDGPFAAGTGAVMELPDGERLSFTFLSVEPGRGFEDETPIPDAEIVVRVNHALAPLGDGGTLITYSMVIDGPGAEAVGPEVGPQISGDFPEVIAALAARAESRSLTR